MQVYAGLNTYQKKKLAAVHNITEEVRKTMTCEEITILFRDELYHVFEANHKGDTPIVPKVGKGSTQWRESIAAMLAFKVIHLLKNKVHNVILCLLVTVTKLHRRMQSSANQHHIYIYFHRHFPR